MRITMIRPNRRGGVIYRFGPLVILLFAAGCVEIRVPDPNVRYIAFGDSATAGPSSRDYPDILRELLDEEPESFVNEGKGGETSEEGLIRLRTLLADGIYPAAAVLLYWEAGNDITDFIKEHDLLLLHSPDDPDFPFAEELAQQLNETQVNIEAAVEAGQDAGLTVYAATYYFLREDIQECDALPLDFILPSQARRTNAYLVRLNERIRAAVAARGSILVDVAAEDELLRASRENYFNCNHLSEQGNALAADLFFDAITKSAD